jgi:hypothetical protein
MNPVRLRDPSGRIGIGDTDSSDRAIRGWRGPDWHRCRNKHNVCPAHPPNTCSSENNNGWKFGVEGGSKWRSPLGYECQYNDKGDLLPDQDANYTYNYAPDALTVQHGLYDFFVHFLFGGDSGYDPGLTTVTECE